MERCWIIQREPKGMRSVTRAFPALFLATLVVIMMQMMADYDDLPFPNREVASICVDNSACLQSASTGHLWEMRKKPTKFKWWHGNAAGMQMMSEMCCIDHSSASPLQRKHARLDRVGEAAPIGWCRGIPSVTVFQVLDEYTCCRDQLEACHRRTLFQA